MDKEGMFKQYFCLINKLVWKYFRQVKYKCSDTFEDLQADGFLIFCEALETYNNEKAAFSTHLWHSLVKGFRMRERHEAKYYSTHVTFDLCVLADNTVDLQIYFHEALQEISDEAKEMLHFILSTDEKLTIGKLQSHFVSTGTFKKIQFDYVIKSLKIWWKSNKNLVNLPKRCQNLQEILENLG